MAEIVTSENIKSILLAGESNTVEFKMNVRHSINFLPRIISAFANTEGGIIIFGYDERKHSVIGTSPLDFEIVKSAISKNSLEDVCNTYTILYEEKTLIIIQVKKSKSIVFAGGGAYARKGECIEHISVLTSKDVVKRIASSVENSTISSNEALERLEQKIEQIYDELLRSQKAHEEELKEAKIEHEKELKDSKKNNWFFCILSAVIGCLLGIILNI